MSIQFRVLKRGFQAIKRTNIESEDKKNTKPTRSQPDSDTKARMWSYLSPIKHLLKRRITKIACLRRSPAGSGETLREV